MKNSYSKTEIQEGERKKNKLAKNIEGLQKTIKEICEEIEQGKEEISRLSPDDPEREKLQAYVSEIELKISSLRNNVDKESKRIIELVDFNELKSEPSEQVFNNEAKIIDLSVKINGPLTEMFIEYFNYLNFNKVYQHNTGIEIKYIFDEAFSFSDSLSDDVFSAHKIDKRVLISYRGTDFMINIQKFYRDNEYVHLISFESNSFSFVNEDYLYKKFLFNVISHSKIKGKYLIMQPGSLSWKLGLLEKRDFSDIFLPESNTQNLEMYISLFKKSGKLLRYLMVGNPGTGKTESTIAIANILNSLGVTVIKTSVCKAFKEKVELAELLSPSVLLLDDIDLSLGSRTRGMISNTLQDFLNILDGTEKIRKDVGFIATTNSLELLDIAASRPGRFDTILAFDSLTHDNIKNIILKSLKYGFNMGGDDVLAKVFTDSKVVNLLHSSRVTGSHIYNAASMLMARIDVLEIPQDKVTVNWVYNEISNDINTTERIRKTSYLKDKMSGRNDNGNGSIGFDLNEDTEEAVTYNDLPFDDEPAYKSESPAFGVLFSRNGEKS